MSQSQAVFVNCLYVARFTICVHSKTQIKFPFNYLLLLFLSEFLFGKSLINAVLLLYYFNIELLVNINQDTKYFVVFHCSFCNDLFNKLLAGFCNKCT